MTSVQQGTTPVAYGRETSNCVTERKTREGLRKDIKSLLKEKNPTLTVRPLRTVWLRVFSPWNFGEMDLEMKGEYQDAAFCNWENMFCHRSNHNEDLQDFLLLWSLPLSIIGHINGNPDSVFHHVEGSDKDSPAEKTLQGFWSRQKPGLENRPLSPRSLWKVSSSLNKSQWHTHGQSPPWLSR